MTSQERDFFTLSNGIFKPIEKKFNIEIQPYEIELIYQLIKDFIKNKSSDVIYRFTKRSRETTMIYCYYL